MARTIVLHDTRTGERRPLGVEPPGPVGIYVCGPTVYDRIHVGNARPYVVFSLLKRFLVHEGYEVRFVSNITDVNDKIYAAAARRGVPSEELAREMTAAYVADTDALGLGRPDAEPRATETIGPIEDLIGALVDSGHAYPAGGDVYFAVRSYDRYGELSHRDPADMDQGEDAGDAARKRDPLDFALWKGAKPGEDTAWDSPWGRGRPGWHIECSAMAEAELGLEFTIHGGGTDLVFPHHENEAAQTAAARGRPLARLWVHNGMVQVQDEKMAKSVGNVFALHEALARFGRDTLVMYFCEGHYRQPIAYSEERLQQAAARVARIKELARRVGPGPLPALGASKEAFFDALANDFNTPAALAALEEWRRAAPSYGAGEEDLREMLGVLGLEGLVDAARDERPDPAALKLAERRNEARAARDFAEADRLRDELRAMGWEVRDLPDGPRLVRAG